MGREGLRVPRGMAEPRGRGTRLWQTSIERGLPADSDSGLWGPEVYLGDIGRWGGML